MWQPQSSFLNLKAQIIAIDEASFSIFNFALETCVDMDDVGIFAPLYSNPQQREVIDRVSMMNFEYPFKTVLRPWEGWPRYVRFADSKWLA